MKNKENHPSYRDVPLSRCENVIYYGDPSNDHIVKIDILSYRKVNEINVPDKLNVQLVNSFAASRGNVIGSIKCSEKYSLYSALDLGFAWVQRSL